MSDIIIPNEETLRDKIAEQNDLQAITINREAIPQNQKASKLRVEINSLYQDQAAQFEDESKKRREYYESVFNTVKIYIALRKLADELLESFFFEEGCDDQDSAKVPLELESPFTFAVVKQFFNQILRQEDANIVNTNGVQFPIRNEADFIAYFGSLSYRLESEQPSKVLLYVNNVKLIEAILSNYNVSPGSSVKALIQMDKKLRFRRLVTSRVDMLIEIMFEKARLDYGLTDAVRNELQTFSENLKEGVVNITLDDVNALGSSSAAVVLGKVSTLNRIIEQLDNDDDDGSKLDYEEGTWGILKFEPLTATIISDVQIKITPKSTVSIRNNARYYNLFTHITSLLFYSTFNMNNYDDFCTMICLYGQNRAKLEDDYTLFRTKKTSDLELHGKVDIFIKTSITKQEILNRKFGAELWKVYEMLSFFLFSKQPYADKMYIKTLYTVLFELDLIESNSLKFPSAMNYVCHFQNGEDYRLYGSNEQGHFDFDSALTDPFYFPKAMKQRMVSYLVTCSSKKVQLEPVAGSVNRIYFFF